jgi:hypothetical protein
MGSVQKANERPSNRLLIVNYCDEWAGIPHAGQ